MLRGSLVAASVVMAGAPARAQQLPDAAEIYFCREDVWNGAYVGLGATLVGVGSALATRDDPRMAAAGWPVIAVGGIEVVVGVVYLALTPGFRADAEAAVRSGTFVSDELERMRAVESGFLYYKLAEGAAAATGVALGVAGAVTHDDTLFGVGAGLGVAAMVQLTMENITHEVARDYIDDLERLSLVPTGTGLAARGRF
jgi:hypothetical protein